MSYHIVVCLSQTLSWPPVFYLSFHPPCFSFSYLILPSLLSQHLQLEGCHRHPIPNSLSCSSLNLDSWPYICFVLGFPSILVEYTSEAHWWPVNPSYLMDPNLKHSTHPVSYPSGWAVLLTSCCSTATSFVQVPSSLLDIQTFFLLHSCSSITPCPNTGGTWLLLVCHLS